MNNAEDDSIAFAILYRPNLETDPLAKKAAN
jgi:hypothetical protein